MKKIIGFALGLLACIAAVSVAGFPDLPTSDPDIGSITYDACVVDFLKDNIFALTFFVAAIICGAFLLCYGFYTKIKDDSSESASYSAQILGAFVVLTGVWILTDSRFFLVFDNTPERTNLENAISLVSFISFLLLPVLYSEFLKLFIKGNKFVNIFESLMALNITVFFILMFFGAGVGTYLCVLLVQHGLIVALIAMNIKLYFRSLFSRQNIREHNLAMGTTLFGIISVVALIAFMAGGYRIYPIIYGTALLVLIVFMVKWFFSEITEKIYRKHLQTEIYKEMAYMDDMTGLYNKNAFLRDVSALADDVGIGIIAMDINSLKEINDTYGHECGDAIIMVAADIIKNAYGSLGKGYRTGGDEFAVICENAEEDKIAAAIANAEERQATFNAENTLQISLATGYAVNKASEKAGDFSSLMNEADRKMYEDKSSKKANKNQ